jgi:hypothetical protein
MKITAVSRLGFVGGGEAEKVGECVSPISGNRSVQDGRPLYGAREQAFHKRCVFGNKRNTESHSRWTWSRKKLVL